jgi:hypothetical protein
MVLVPLWQPHDDDSSMNCLNQNQGLLTYFYFFCVALLNEEHLISHQENDSLLTIRLEKSPTSTSLLIGWSPCRDLPSSLFPFSSCALLLRCDPHCLLASFMSQLHHSTHKRCGSTYSTNIGTIQ